MKKSKQGRLAKAGWKVGTAKQFLGLSDEENAMIEMKLALADSLKKKRLEHDMTQSEFAQKLGSSQSRVAKMEAADVSVSLDLLVRSLLVLGSSRKEIGKVIGKNSVISAA